MLCGRQQKRREKTRTNGTSKATKAHGRQCATKPMRLMPSSTGCARQRRRASGCRLRRLRRMGSAFCYVSTMGNGATRSGQDYGPMGGWLVMVRHALSLPIGSHFLPPLPAQIAKERAMAKTIAGKRAFEAMGRRAYSFGLPISYARSMRINWPEWARREWAAGWISQGRRKLPGATERKA